MSHLLAVEPAFPMSGAVYPADLPTVRNLPHSSVRPPGADDTCDIHLSRTPAPVPIPPQPEFPRVRGYLVQSFVGSGGMGVVYKARHIDLQRTVALKMLHESAAADREANERFQAEAEAMARVQHPNIIQVFEIGLVQPQAGEHRPRPFISLEFMDGGCLTRHTESPQSPAFAARMVEKLARGAHAAHVLGVVHRDLKPANVLLTKDGEPKIADFGVAKLIGEDTRLLTQDGMTVGTPEYMAPEQAAGEDSGASADIYSLGVILYQLLTARLPFHGSNPVDTMYLVRNEEPVSPRRFQPKLPRDLETICLKCLSKRPSRRYETAEALAEDLNRWAEGRTICARPVGRIERGLLWVKRNPTIAALSVAIVLVAQLGIAGVVLQWQKAEQQAEEATKETQRALASEAAAKWDQYRAAILATSGSIRLDNSLSARRMLDSAPREHHRNWEWQYFHHQLDTSRDTFQTDNKPYIVISTPDAERLVTVAEGDRTGFWDPFTGTRLATYENGAHLGRSTPHPNGESMAYIPSEPNRNFAVIRHLRSDRPDITVGRSDKLIRSVRYSPDGTLIATGDMDGLIRICETATGKERIAFQAHPTACGNMDISRDNRLIATCGSSDKCARIWDVKTGERLHSFEDHSGEIENVWLCADGTRLIAGVSSPAMTFWMWDLTGRQPKKELSGHANAVRWSGFSPSTHLFATCCLDQKARLWDGKTGELRHELAGHTGWVEHAAFSPDGTRLATASHDCTLRIWDTKTGATVAVLRGHNGPVLNVAYSRDGATIVSTARDGKVKLWNAREAERGDTIRGHQSYVYGVACHPDNERIASASWDGTVRIWNARTGKQLHRLTHGDGKSTIVSAVAFHPNGKVLASVSRDDTVRLWDVETGREKHRFTSPIGHWMDTRVSFSPDGSLMAAGDNQNRVRIWNVETFSEYATLEGHTHIIRDLAFSPDGRHLATGGADCSIRIWDVRKKELATLIKPDPTGGEGHSEVVYALAFSPNGECLASGSIDGTVRLWDTHRWGESHVLKHASNVYGLAFTPDGTRLASACSDRSIRLWHVQTRHELAELRGHGDYVHSVAFTPDGTKMISGSGDNTIHLWDSGPKPTPTRP